MVEFGVCAYLWTQVASVAAAQTLLVLPCLGVAQPEQLIGMRIWQEYLPTLGCPAVPDPDLDEQGTLTMINSLVASSTSSVGR